MSARKTGVTTVFVLLVAVLGSGQTGSSAPAAFTTRPGFVEVPVTVKDSSGRLLESLSPDDFALFEDGVQQKLVYFSRKALPLSATILVDTNLRPATLERVMRTLPALMGSFTSGDEVAVYRYGNSVQQIVPFTPMDPGSGEKSEWLKWAGEPGDHPAPDTSGNSGQTASGPGDVYPASPETSVLNDAILRAAQDLSRRDHAGRRRVILIIGNGREQGSTARYAEVRKLLLSQNISVYAVSISDPDFLRYGRLLSQYAAVSGGDLFMTRDERSIDEAYNAITNQARNQYALGYYTQSGDSFYHAIDVHVHHPHLTVIAKCGYYAPGGQK